MNTEPKEQEQLINAFNNISNSTRGEQHEYTPLIDT